MTSSDRYNILLLEQEYWGEQSSLALESGDEERKEYCDKMWMSLLDVLDAIDTLDDEDLDDEAEADPCSKCDVLPAIVENEVFGGYLVICYGCKWVIEGGDEEDAIRIWNEAHGGDKNVNS
jgi:hypothetical protein